MADITFNISVGESIAYFKRVKANDPANSQLVLVMLKTVESDTTLIDYDDLATILAQAGNVECDFTNYARQTYTDADLAAITPDDANDRQDAILPAKSIANAGGTTDNTILKAILCYDPDSTGGTDSDLVPIKAFDATETTNGQTLNIPQATVARATGS